MNNPKQDDKDTIIVRPPKGTKAKWVRQSQSEGKKLTDWIVERVEARPHASKPKKVTQHDL